MRYLSIGFPSKAKVVSGGGNNETTKFENNDGAGYGVELVDAGEFIDPDSTLYIETSVGNISGQHRVREHRSGVPAMPAMFSEGVAVRYKYGIGSGIPGPLDMVGQSTKGVKEYYPIRFFNSSGVREYPTYDNSVLMSYRNSLYLFIERRRTIFSTPVTHETKVEIYKSTNGMDFHYHYSFPKLPRAGLEGLSSSSDTKASITVTEHNGRLVAAYRQLDNDKTFVVVYRSEDDDVLDWQEVSTVEIRGASFITKGFKLRIASGGDSLMLVYCSHSQETISLSPPFSNTIHKSDFRYYISHDGGDTFVDPEETYQKISPDSRRIGSDRITNLAPLFKDVDAAPISQFDYISQEPMSVGFDLYFDKDMGSFVILKASDSQNRMGYQDRLGNGKLIGIKTLPGDIYNWEKCLEIRTDRIMTGLQTNYREDLLNFEDVWNKGTGSDVYPAFAPPFGYNPDNRPLGWGNWMGYVVTDVEVVPGDVISDLILRVSQDTVYCPGVETGIAIGEFRFVDVGLLAPGDSSIAYGVKTHEDYAFVGTMMNHRVSGLLHRGVPSSISISEPGVDPYFRDSFPVTSVRHKGELLVQFVQAVPTPYGAVLGPYSNIGETKGYELSYPRYRGNIASVGVDLEGAVQKPDHVEAKGIGNHPVPPSYVSLSESQINLLTGEHPYNSILRFISLTREKFIKVKFDMELESDANLGGSGEFVFFDMLISGHKQDPVYDLRVRLSIEKAPGQSGRNIVLYYGEPMTFMGMVRDRNGLSASLDLSQRTEFLIAHSPVLSPVSFNAQFFLFYRQEGNRDWTLGIMETTPLEEISPPKPLADRISYIKIGFVQSLVPAFYDDNVKVGSLAVSALGAGNRAVYTKVKDLHNPLEVEPFARLEVIEDGLTNDKYLAMPVQVFDRTLPILDQSEIMLTGGNIEESKTSRFTLARRDRRNPEETVTDGIADSVYDFTERWLEEPDFEIVISNEDEDLIDVMTLVNLNGVSSVTVTSGYWNDQGGVWSNYLSQTYQVPMIEVDVEAVDGRTVLFTGVDFEPGQIVGYSFFSYNDVTRVWEYCRLIVDNVGDVLKLDRPIPNITPKVNKFLIAKNIMSFDIGELAEKDVNEFYPSHYGFKFNSADDATFRAVGEINIGKWVDISNHVIETSSKTKDNARTISSDFGNLYPSLVKKGNVIDEIDIDFTYLRTDNGEASMIKDLMLSLRRARRAFPLIEYHTDGQKVQYVTVSGSVESSMDGYGERLKASLTSQAWYPRPNYGSDQVDYSFVLNVDHIDPVKPGDLVSFSIAFLDPLASIGSNVVLWRVDEGVEIRNQSMTASYAYTSSGGRVVMVRVVRPDGRVLALKRVSVFIGDES